MTTHPRDPRRFFRFGLRSLLLLVAFTAVLAWLYRQLVVAHREQREFLAAAEKLGARVTIQPWRSSDTLAWSDTAELGILDRVVEVDFCGDGFWRFDHGQPVEHIHEPYGANFDYRVATNRPDPRPDVGMPEKQRLAATHECLRRLRAISSVKRLSLGDWAVDEESLKLLRNLKTLEHLELRGNPLPRGALVHLSGLAGLKHLGLSSTGITDDDLAQLPDLSGLETLDLSDTQVSDAGVEALRLDKLKRLYLVYGKRLDAVRIGALPRLEHLDLGGSNARSLRIENAPLLRSLNLAQTFRTYEALANLRASPQLQRLGIAGTPITGRGLGELRQLPQLEELCTDLASIDDPGLDHLRAFPSLKELRLVLIGISDESSREKKVRAALPAAVQIKSSPAPFSNGNAAGGFF